LKLLAQPVPAPPLRNQIHDAHDVPAIGLVDPDDALARMNFASDDFLYFHARSL
jgi:hypothetical protein